MVNNGEHAVVLKGHKRKQFLFFNYGSRLLNIRDSARDQNSPAEIWIKENNSPYNKMNLTVMGNGEKMVFYFELS